MNVLSVAAGVAIICAILWEVFHDLFNPSGSGALSDWVGRGLFAVGRRWPAFLPEAGPLALVVVIVVWVAALILGFALIYTVVFPAAFRTSTSTVPPTSPHFLAVLYFSFATIITLGYGDLVPELMPVRLTATFEALVGFAILTASVSSIVLIYPALTRMRTLALGVSHLVTAERRTGIMLAQANSEVVLAGLARDVTHARIDLVHFPIIYYFAPRNDRASIAKWTGVLQRFAREGSAIDHPPQVRIAAAALDAALADLAETLADGFLGLPTDDADAVFAAFAAYHRVDRPAC